MRSTVFLALLSAFLALPALATPPLRMDSQGVVQAKSLSSTDGGVHTLTGVSTFLGGIEGFNVPAIAPPTPVVTSNITLDGGGASTYTYAITACSTATCAAGSESALGATGSTTTSIATPTATYPNLVTIPATVGALGFGVWETSPTGARMGLLAVVAQKACSNAGDYCGATFLDTGAALVADLSPGLAGNGDAGPVNDLSAEVKAGALFVGAQPATIVSGINGAAPTTPEYCELFTYQIASGTAAAHDAGFFRTFNTAPAGCTFSVVTGDGGAIIGTAGINPVISTTGFTFTSSANVSETLNCSCCGN